ncbi:hypothetical protein MTO96_000438 [Rhipicephalus appendiculatus]
MPPQRANEPTKVRTPPLTRSRAKAIVPEQRRVSVEPPETLKSSDEPAVSRKKTGRPPARRARCRTQSEVGEKMGDFATSSRENRRVKKVGSSNDEYFDQMKATSTKKKASRKFVGRQTSITWHQPLNGIPFLPQTDALSTNSGSRRHRARDKKKKCETRNGLGRSSSKRRSLRLANLLKVESYGSQYVGKRDSTMQFCCLARTPISRDKKTPEYLTQGETCGSNDCASVWPETPTRARTPDGCRRKLFPQDYNDSVF